MTDKEPIDVNAIVLMHLRHNGYDGLWNPEGQCACKVDDLAPCGEMTAECTAGYERACDCGDHDYHIGPPMTEAEKKEAAEMDEENEGEKRA